MRKYLLLTLMMLLTVVAKAEYNTTYYYSADYEYPEGVINGAGTYSYSDFSDYMSTESYYIWFKYTPTEDVAFKYTNTSCSVSVYGPYTNGSGVGSIRNSYVYDGTATYYNVLSKDTTYYIRIYAYSESSTFTWEEVEDVTILRGSQDDPAVIDTAKTYFIGDQHCNGYPYSYATYTAPSDLSSDENNLLNIQFGYNVIGSLYVACDGDTTNYTVSNYKTSFAIEAGKTYSLYWSSTYLPYVQATISHPTEGSIDLPYTLGLGENTGIVPAEAGTYYYTFNPEGSTGYFSIAGSSDEGNTVTVYTSKGNATSSYASSYVQATGSYDCEWEVTDKYSTNDWFFVLEKTVATEAAETLEIIYSAYVAGETEDNPIVIDELPFNDTLSHANGTFYYTFTAPESWTDSTLLKYSRENGGDGTDYAVEFYIYDSDYNIWNYVYDSSLSVEGLVAGTTYNIEFTVSNQTDPIIFTLDSAQVEAGDFITNPLTATDGDNILTKSGSVYYQYTATQTGKFEMDVHDTNIAATFPQSADSWYDWDWTLNGSVYSMEVEEGTDYLICITGAEVGDTFTISYGEYAPGESKVTAINVNELENTTYHLSEANGLSNIWLLYTMTKDGGLTIDGTSMDYSWYNYAYIYEPGAEYASYMEQLDENYDYYYYYDGTFSEKDSIYVQLQINYWSYCEGDSLVFTERDYKDGEVIAKAFTLQTNVVDTVTLDASPSDSPVWFKFDVPKAGDVMVNIGAYSCYNLYAGIEEAEADTEPETSITGSRSTVTLPDGTTATMYAYETSTDTAVTYYMYMDDGDYSEISFYIVVPDTVLADITITANTPEDEGEVEELSEIVLDVDLDDWVLDVDSAMTAVELYSKIAGTTYAIDTIVKNDEGQLVITTDTIADEVSLTLVIPEGILGNSRYISSGRTDGHTNATAVFYYDVVPAAEPVEYEWISEPAANDTVEYLDTIVVYIGDKSTALSVTWNVNPIIVCGTDTTEINVDTQVGAEWDTDWSTYNYSWLEIALVDTIDTAGDYTLIFPVGSLMVEDKDYEEEVSFSWTVTGPSSEEENSEGEGGGPNGISNINATVNYLDGEVYTISGMRVKNTESLPAGIYIINGKKIAVKK